jgi:hypothetical protein
MRRRSAAEDETREDRILFEIVVDAYNETERAMSWYYYLQDKLEFPFAGQCRATRTTSPLKVNQEVEVLAMALEDDCMSEILVMVKLGRSKIAVPLEQIDCRSKAEGTCQGVADWHYWRARGYEY